MSMIDTPIIVQLRGFTFPCAAWRLDITEAINHSVQVRINHFVQMNSDGVTQQNYTQSHPEHQKTQVPDLALTFNMIVA